MSRTPDELNEPSAFKPPRQDAGRRPAATDLASATEVEDDVGVRRRRHEKRGYASGGARTNGCEIAMISVPQISGHHPARFLYDRRPAYGRQQTLFTERKSRTAGRQGEAGRRAA